jgi:hypothetical protein
MSSVFPALSSPAMTIFAERDGGSDGLSKPGWLDVQTWRREDYDSESHLPSSCVSTLGPCRLLSSLGRTMETLEVRSEER